MIAWLRGDQRSPRSRSEKPRTVYASSYRASFFRCHASISGFGWRSDAGFGKPSIYRGACFSIFFNMGLFLPR